MPSSACGIAPPQAGRGPGRNPLGPAAIPGVALVIVQHVDAQFARGLALAGRPDRASRGVAREGMRPAADTVLVACTNDHLVLGNDLALHYTPTAGLPYRPSINAFFLSLARCWPRRMWRCF